ncbi:hypothetical protein BN946_scf185042.g147 [Trametes cinnabarina]|uniref:Uncharacterized protein n=1 Tax=Pycnoporus cinnabarinus TaxID=5643 RepID=A0A060S4I6_PYCCI|nr:hypothetical protein BN946_scf185042.g147 [Trametes cinnabarina]
MSDLAKTKSVSTSDAVVTGRSIVWVGDLTKQRKSDVLESTLFGQAAADKQHSPGTRDWYQTYILALETTGWVIVHSSESTEVTHGTAEVGTVADTVLALLMQDATVDKQLYASIARALLDFSRAGDDSPAANVFNNASVGSSSKSASFQIAVASTEGENVTLTLWTYFYRSDQKVEKALWFKNPIQSMETLHLKLTLNSEVYEAVRSTIHERLSNAGQLDSLVPLCESGRLFRPLPPL